MSEFEKQFPKPNYEPIKGGGLILPTPERQEYERWLAERTGWVAAMKRIDKKMVELYDAEYDFMLINTMIQQEITELEKETK